MKEYFRKTQSRNQKVYRQYSDSLASSSWDSVVDENVENQAYHTKKRTPGESTNKYRVRMEDAIIIMKRLETYVLLKTSFAIFEDRAKHGHMLTDLKIRH